MFAADRWVALIDLIRCCRWQSLSQFRPTHIGTSLTNELLPMDLLYVNIKVNHMSDANSMLFVF